MKWALSTHSFCCILYSRAILRQLNVSCVHPLHILLKTFWDSFLSTLLHCKLCALHFSKQPISGVRRWFDGFGCWTYCLLVWFTLWPLYSRVWFTNFSSLQDFLYIVGFRWQYAPAIVANRSYWYKASSFYYPCSGTPRSPWPNNWHLFSDIWQVDV